jgi:hypothetical protein
MSNRLLEIITEPDYTIIRMQTHQAMKVALLHRHYNEGHLASVTEEMRTLGVPTIKAVWMETWQMWVAMEGCHRLRAAHALGLTPVIEELDYSDEMISMDDGDHVSVSAICDDAYNAQVLTF